MRFEFCAYWPYFKKLKLNKNIQGHSHPISSFWFQVWLELKTPMLKMKTPLLEIKRPCA
jgi:hypothetical protein